MMMVVVGTAAAGVFSAIHAAGSLAPKTTHTRNSRRRETTAGLMDDEVELMLFLDKGVIIQPLDRRDIALAIAVVEGLIRREATLCAAKALVA